ncbi:chorismate mutase [Sorangium sp. So ce693]|uniref:chorismate mutase n=1 Tax=Sorangium sp. So ce693 TaxID=3133318 RepID=UPI003F5FE411
MTLDGFRDQIDRIDDELVDLLGRRLNIVREVALAKKVSATPVMQPARVIEVKRRCRERGSHHQLRGEFIETIYQAIIDEACRIEDDLLRG